MSDVWRFRRTTHTFYRFGRVKCFLSTGQITNSKARHALSLKSPHRMRVSMMLLARSDANAIYICVSVYAYELYFSLGCRKAHMPNVFSFYWKLLSTRTNERVLSAGRAERACGFKAVFQKLFETPAPLVLCPIKPGFLWLLLLTLGRKPLCALAFIRDQRRCCCC
jgi:hypothetical protein